MIKLPIQVKMKVAESETHFKLRCDTVIKPVHNAPEYEGEYIITPLAHNPVVLDTRGKLCTDDITVIKIPTYETHNDYGMTFFIREGNNGN